jgi:SAM-dependent methyltransferase
MRNRIAILTVAALMAAGCSGMSKLDYGKLHSRAGWQLPEQVIESLKIEEGAHVADLGAGDGYFVFRLADAVGPRGRVYAVDVDEEIVEKLRARVAEEGYSNVEVILGEFGDPKLPDARIDLVFLCNTYHHIDDRPDYFARLKMDLGPGGRVAVIDMRSDLSGFLSLFTDEGHDTPLDELDAEMNEAGYHRSEAFDFLPIQNFQVFAPGERVAQSSRSRIVEMPMPAPMHWVASP